MNLDKLVAVSGMPGISRIAGNRNNGVLLENLDTGKRKFASVRKYQFTPLESIAIYTDGNDSIELAKIFTTMLEQKSDNPAPAPNGDPKAIKEYFEGVLPNYDRDQVHLSDMKKVIKWFNYLDERNLLSLEEDSSKAEETTEEEAK